MLPLPSDVWVALTHPPQITAGGLSSFLKSWPAPAASSALLSAAYPDVAASKTARAMRLLFFPCVTFVFIRFPLLLIHARMTGGRQRKKRRPPGRSLTRRTSLSFKSLLALIREDAVVPSVSSHDGGVYTRARSCLSSGLHRRPNQFPS